MERVDQMKKGHLKVGDIVRLGWPAARGKYLFEVLEVCTGDIINDIKVKRVDQEGEFFTRSLGAEILRRQVQLNCAP